jgi:hypothetical protein
MPRLCPRPGAALRDHRIAESGQHRAGHRAAAHLSVRRWADMLRDEGEAYAAKLRSAGVAVTAVRYNGTIHDFMLLNALSETRATRAAIDQATAFLRAGLGTT